MKSLRLILPATALMAALSLCCCSGKEKHLSKGEMADVMADMELADAYAQTVPGMAGDSARAVLRNSILEKHGITQAEFDATLSWYGHNIEKFTELYDEVDKRLEKRQKKLLASAGEGSGDNAGSLWPYSAMAMLSTLSAQDAIEFSVPAPEMEKGDRLEWKMRLSRSVPVNMVLGVDYKEGGTSYVFKRFSSDRALELTLQSDSTRNISRLYGVMTVTSGGMLPIWADSISLKRLPLAGETYYRYNTQTNYNGPRKAEPRDTMRPPTVRPIREPEMNGPESKEPQIINVDVQPGRPGSR